MTSRSCRSVAHSSSAVSIARCWTNRLSCHPAARTSSNARTALAVLAVTAIAMPNTGPNRRPAASVNTVRGNGSTVTTMCAARNASGNQGPTDWAQSRSCTALGSGTHSATATKTVIPTTAPTARGRDSWRALEPSARERLRSVLVVLAVAGLVT